MSYTSGKMKANSIYATRNTHQSYGMKVSPHSYPASQFNHLKYTYEDGVPAAVLADEIFGVGRDDTMEAVSDDCHYSNSSLTNDVEFQYFLDLENADSLVSKYKNEINRYKKAYEKMAINALRWHLLIEDIENDETLFKLFNDIQLLRKLSGGSVF